MSAFGSYAPFYDLLYRDKAYGDESAFVISRLESAGAGISRLLDLGCGTGIHALQFAEAGYHVLGVDASAGMLELAERRRAAATAGVAARVRFHESDIRNFAVAEQFDAAVSLFHVMSYQVHDDDVASAIAAARRHLKCGCRFLFDFWYGPAVVASGPTVRRKEAESDSVRVVRVATPSWDRARNVVNVHYRFTVQKKSDGTLLEFDENHVMRYFFPDELERMLRDGGFRIVNGGEWLTDRSPTEASFSAYMIAVAA
jgi:SAM-dependent methyltransferase